MQNYRCIQDGHNSYDLNYVCTDPNCSHQKLCCFHCLKQYHEKHNQNVVELEPFILDVHEFDKTLSDIQYIANSIYWQIQAIFDRVYQDIAYFQKLYTQYQDQAELRKMKKIENISDSRFILNQAHQTLTKFKLYVDQFNRDFTLVQRNPQQNPQQLCGNLKIAVDRMKDKQHEAALFYIGLCLDEDASNSEALTLKSSCLLNLGFMDQALAIAQVSYALDSKNINNLLILGRYYIKIKNYSEARNYISQGLKIDPNHQLLKLLQQQIPIRENAQQQERSVIVKIITRQSFQQITQETPTPHFDTIKIFKQQFILVSQQYNKFIQQGVKIEFDEKETEIIKTSQLLQPSKQFITTNY